MPSFHVARQVTVPRFGVPSLLRQTGVVLGATALMAICSHISLPVPFSPVPTTMQTFGVLVLGMLLGPAGGFVALAAYLLEGLAGAPVFSPQGAPGMAHLVGPTGGFLFAYPVAAAVAGSCFRALRARVAPSLAAVIAGTVALLPVFALGTVWLSRWSHLPLRPSVALGVTPFLPGEVLKLALVVALVTLLSRVRSQPR